MSKKSKPKFRRKGKITPTPIVIEPKLEKKPRFSFLAKAIFIIAALAGIAIAYEPIKDFFLSPREKFHKDYYKEGDLKAPIIQKQYSISEFTPNFNSPARDDIPHIKGILLKDIERNHFLILNVSGFVFTCFDGDLKRGIDIFTPAFKDCISAHLLLCEKDDRLYVSVEFKDIQNEQTIGWIEYNHWNLYIPNMLDFKNDDERLEVIDKQNNIVFSINYVEPVGGVSISGYFIGSSSIIVMPNSPSHKSKLINNPLCVSKTDPAWKQKALQEIVNIKSIF